MTRKSHTQQVAPCKPHWPQVAWALYQIEDMLDARKKGTSAPEAERAIHESVLSVCVRDGWRPPGSLSEDGPEEYEILLSTGGPALRIFGRLNEYGEPKSAELQMQDWGTPWTRYPAPETTILTFARCFWFGE